jgi:glycosyltransferase involved in cell wall biosynthesis
LKISIVGVVGLPANYGGFETLVENLVKYHKANKIRCNLTIYCSGLMYPKKSHVEKYETAKLRYIPLKANGLQSILYDAFSLLSSVWYKSDVVLLLGVSGAFLLPMMNFFNVKIISNIDGIEWKRNKWRGLSKLFLRLSEKLAVRYSHEVIADNAFIAQYVELTYGRKCHVIAYGGDHAIAIHEDSVFKYELPDSFAFSVCRIEPENNVHLIISAFSQQSKMPLVIVGNWDNSDYGRKLRKLYSKASHLYLFDPIYDLCQLKLLRSKASYYIHGHSAGGTNPSLVEAMHFGKSVLAFDCEFNRATTENKAFFFKDVRQLLVLISSIDQSFHERVGIEMVEIAQRRYTWAKVAQEYFDLIEDVNFKIS